MRVVVEACDACPVRDGASIHRDAEGGFVLDDLDLFDVIDPEGERRQVLLCPQHAGQLRSVVGLAPAAPL